MKLESLLCRLQSYAKQQHRASQFNNFCCQRGHTAQRMTVLLLLLKIVGRFVLHCNSCSSLCIVPVKRNICHGPLPPCEMFGWILPAQQSELLVKSCLDRGSPLLSCYWVCAEQEPLHSCKLPLPQQTCKTKVNGLQCMARYSGCYCITEALHREEFCRFLTVFKEMFKLKLVKHLCKTSQLIFTLSNCSIKLYKLWKFNFSLLLSLLEQLSVSVKLISFCLCL